MNIGTRLVAGRRPALFGAALAAAVLGLGLALAPASAVLAQDKLVEELLDQAGGAYTSVWLGTLAGLVSAILVALLLITYHMYPEPSRG